MKPKRLPRLWCAMQGLLPVEACLAAQRGELAWPAETTRKPRVRRTAIRISRSMRRSSDEGEGVSR
jgi:hypothetical protein